jgi:hypothetical protein
MAGWIIFISPVRAMLRLAMLLDLLSLFLMIYRYEVAWQYALLGALGAVGLAVVAWVLWTLFEVLVLIGGLTILVARAIRGVFHAGREVALRALLPAVLVLTLAAPTAGQIHVIDTANLAQNTRTALQMVESVLKQVEIIRNQMTQIENMVQNTTRWGGSGTATPSRASSASGRSSSRSRPSPTRWPASMRSSDAASPATGR